MNSILRRILNALFPSKRKPPSPPQEKPRRPRRAAPGRPARQTPAAADAARKRPAKQRSARGRAEPNSSAQSFALLTLALLLTLTACQTGAGDGTPSPEVEPTERPTPTQEAAPTEPAPSESTPQAATPVARPQSPGQDVYPAPGSEDPPTAEEQQATPTSAAGSGYPPPVPGAQQVSMPAAEGLSLAGTLYTPPSGTGPWPGVLLLHMLGSERGAWADPAAALAEAGFVALAVDMRGHGETGGEIDWDLAVEDLRLALGFLSSRPEVDASRTAIAGASIGANLALVVGAAEEDVRALVLLSPGLDYAGVTTLEALGEYDGRPLLIAAGEGDSYAASSSETLAELAPGGAELELYAGGAHGTSLFDAEPGLIELMKDWLGEVL